MDDEEQKDRVKALFQQSLRPAETPTNPPQSPQLRGKTVIIHGGWHQYAPPRAKVVVVVPGALISKAQKTALVALRDQWVALHNTHKARQITRADARKALNAQAQVAAHRLIPADRYADLVAWLISKMSRLDARPSAQIIHFQTRCNDQLRDHKDCGLYINRD